MKTRDQMILDYYALEDELYAQSVWSGHETAIIYLDELYKKNRETMKRLNLSTTDLDEKQRKASEGLNNLDNLDNLDNRAFSDFKILDDRFLDAMDKACYLIGKKLNTSRKEAIEILKRKKKGSVLFPME